MADESSQYSKGQRAVAVLAGVACHLSFALGVAAMVVGLYDGLRLGRGPFHGPAAIVANAVLIAQFPILHSWMLTAAGRRARARLVPARLGGVLDTTTYATAASLQLLAVFGLWSPSGVVWWQPEGAVLAVLTALYALAWLGLAKTMRDAGLAVQTGALGWRAVARGQRPVFGDFPRHGTFRHTRQPIYVAFTLTLWTAPVWTPDRALLTLGWTAYCVIGPLLKEHRYLARHAERFARYRERVPYWWPSWKAHDLDAP